MKKLLLGALVFSAFASDAQVKKVLLHDYTGVNCQFCTDGTVRLEAIHANNPTNFIPVQIHAGIYTPASSPLKTPEGDAIDAFAQPQGYPAGTVDMVKYAPAATPGAAMGRGSWEAAFNVRKALPAIASISINNRKKTGPATYEADVVIQFNTAPSAGQDVSINVFILEDSIKADGALKQINYSGGPYSGASPLTYGTHGYKHNNVLRKTLLGNWGKNLTNVTATSKHTEKITWTVDTTASPVGINRANMRIVAYLAYNTALNKEILNAEMLSVSKTFFPAGVDNVVNNVEIFSAYPNPAKLGSVVNVEYNISTPQLVTMNVYNMAGQKVATPYVSNEVEGGHTIMWKTGFDNLAPGTYIIEVATAEGRQTQKVTLQ